MRYRLCCVVISQCYVQRTENKHYVNLTALFYIKHIQLRHQLHKCHKQCGSQRKIKSKNCILCFVDRASLYNLFQMKPNRCTLLLSIFISTSLHVSGNYVPIIRTAYCIYGTMVFFSSVWMAVWSADSLPYRVKKIPVSHRYNKLF